MMPPPAPPQQIDYVIWHASWIEISFILLLIVAMFVNILLLRVAYLNSNALMVSGLNGARQYAVNTQVIREIIRITSQVALLYVAVRAIYTPNFKVVAGWDYYVSIACLMYVAYAKAMAATVDYVRFNVLLSRVDTTEILDRIDQYGKRGKPEQSSTDVQTTQEGSS